MKGMYLVAASGASEAEALGYLVGTLVGLAAVLGILVFALVALIKAFTRRTRGWIIAGAVGALILAVPVVLVIAGLVSGVTGVLRQSHHNGAAMIATVSATVHPVAGTSAVAKKSPPNFSNRTETVIAQLKTLGLDPTVHFRIAVQNVENTAGQFFASSNNMDTNAILDPEASNPRAIKLLQDLRRTATELVLAVREYKDQLRAELLSAKLSSAAQEQILSESQSGYDHIEAAAASAVKAAEAGLALRDAYARGKPRDATQEEFSDAWNNCSKAMNVLIDS